MREGRCNYCGGLYSKAGMTKHLASCEQRKAVVNAKKGERKNHLRIIAQDRYLSDYWMHLKVLDETTLTGLDFFLRDIWVECCGHASIFTIGGVNYCSFEDSFFLEDENMDFRLRDSFGCGNEVSLPV